MDSICDNTGLINYDSQVAFAEAAVNRLVYPSVLQVEGWRLIPAIPKLLRTFNMNIDDVIFVIETARHPSNTSPAVSTNKTFDEILSEGGTLLRMVSTINNLI